MAHWQDVGLGSEKSWVRFPLAARWSVLEQGGECNWKSPMNTFLYWDFPYTRIKIIQNKFLLKDKKNQEIFLFKNKNNPPQKIAMYGVLLQPWLQQMVGHPERHSIRNSQRTVPSHARERKLSGNAEQISCQEIQGLLCICEYVFITQIFLVQLLKKSSYYELYVQLIDLRGNYFIFTICLVTGASFSYWGAA